MLRGNLSLSIHAFWVLTATCPCGGDVGGNGAMLPVLVPHQAAALELAMGLFFPSSSTTKGFIKTKPVCGKRLQNIS